MLDLRRRHFLTFLGGAAAWPLVAHAQQPGKLPTIGFLSSRSPEESEYLLEAFRQGLNEGGFVEGQNVAIEFRWAHGQYDRLPALAAELVSRGVTVLDAIAGEPVALAAMRATSTIPIVFMIGGDPVETGLVKSFNRPGGNVTGVTLLTSMMEPKRLGLLHELVPDASLIGVLMNPNFLSAARQLQDLEEAARTIGQRLVISNASRDEELDAAFMSLVQEHVGALFVGSDPYFNTRRDRIVAFAAKQRLPAIYQFREYAVAGGLLSYGINLTDAYRQCGVYIAKVLKGARPADLPIMQPTKFELVINLKTAKVLGVKISDNLRSLADEVIE
jgi:putative tryptophan/tyrosine transport system substrate-binding protein